ncbi:ankyrin [Apiospora kogelbergensis]|uniref:Ankyrin n=1 Tax=Apiospora kogelbergensis TaxID=1337665 RepID=A0AAW0QF26_9PEZI
MSEAHSAVVLQKMSAKNWDDYRELISRWYISEKKTAPCIIEELQKPEHGFNVALYELKDRFATWRLRKNLSRPEQNVWSLSGSESEKNQLVFGSSAIDKLSVSFSSLMPESREGENMARAKSLVRTRGELDMEMLKLVLFQLSNNFITEEDYENVVRLTERLGLGSPSVIRALFGVATRDLTIAAILDKLFIAACKTYSLKLVEVVVKENKEVLAFYMMLALNVSIIKQDIRVAKIIIAADTESTIGQDLGKPTIRHGIGRVKVLEELVQCKNDQFTSALVELLIPKIALLQSFLERLLFRALEAGNASLAIKSIKCGADTCAKELPPVFAPLPDWIYDDSGIKITTSTLIMILDSHTIYTACIVPFCQYHYEPPRFLINTNGVTEAIDPWELRSLRSEDTALRTYEQMAASLGSHWSTQIGEESVPIDVLLSAAFLGYSSILKKFTPGPQDLNRTNGRGMSPLIAAVLGGSADACSCLLKLGADPNFTHSNSLDSSPSQSEPAAGLHPAALHHAIFLGHRQIVELLIKSGADINQSFDHSTMHHCPWVHFQGCWWCINSGHKPGLICSMDSKAINALSIATKRGYQEVSGLLRADTTDTECDYLEVSKLLLQNGVHSGCLELHLAIDFGHRCLVEEILSKSDTVEHLDAPLSGTTPFQAALQTRNGPVCEALLAAGFNIDAKPENLSLAAEGGSAQVVRRLLRILKTTSSSCTSESTKALQVAFKSGFPNIAEILVGEGVPLPSNWWHGVFGTYQLESLLSTLERIQFTQDVVEHAPQDGRSVLEAAMQNPHAGVAGFALDRFPQAYDSGALLARLCTGLSANESSPDALLDELVRRRDAAQDEDLTPALENAAIALAAYFQKNDLLRALLERPQPHAPALVPGPDLWDILLIRGEKPCTFPNCFCYMACRNDALLRERLGGGSWWHLEDPMCRLRKTSPLFMAVKGRDPKAIHQLISKGYKPDLPTLIATIDWKELTPTMQRLLETARKNGLGFGLWERCSRIVEYILEDGCLETLQLLTGHKEKVSNLYYDTTCSYRKDFDGPKTALQLAIHANRASDEMLYYLIGKGADVTAPANHNLGELPSKLRPGKGRSRLLDISLGREPILMRPEQLWRAEHVSRQRQRLGDLI